MDTRSEDQNYSDHQVNNDDEVYPESSVESHLGVALLDANEDCTSFSIMEQSSSRSLGEYLKEDAANH